MKKVFNKIKACLISLQIMLISFSSKVMAWTFETEVMELEELETWKYENPQPSYWIPYQRFSSPVEPTDTIIKTIPRLLVVITFVVWIVSFIKIRKIDDKVVKRKKIKNAVITVSILVVLIIALFVFAPSLMEYFS
jgi:hypothetical protein